MMFRSPVPGGSPPAAAAMDPVTGVRGPGKGRHPKPVRVPGEGNQELVL